MEYNMSHHKAFQLLKSIHTHHHLSWLQ